MRGEAEALRACLHIEKGAYLRKKVRAFRFTEAFATRVPENNELESKTSPETLSNSPPFGISPAIAELESRITRKLLSDRMVFGTEKDRA